ncbi:MAG: hypothetical protein NVS9B15_07620 [Acidobacteriaceae bacterium]
MDHLVGERPIVKELVGAGSISYGDDDEAASAWISNTVMDSGPGTSAYAQSQMGDRKLSKVGSDRVCGSADPRQQILA